MTAAADQAREIRFDEVNQIMTDALRDNHAQKDLAGINGAKRAAIMCVLYPKDRQPYILLTKRRANLFDHGGEISFPGGSKEDADIDLLETALREVDEELGLTVSRSEIVGELDEVFTFSSHFVISPFLAIVNYGPIVKSVSSEVSYVIEANFNQLLDPSIYREDKRVFEGNPYSISYYNYGKEVIW
ncbi:MAG: NUDIX hydrolase, partial [Nitrososphaerales archaeon]